MILFVVPVAAGSTRRRPNSRVLYPDLSLWRLLGHEMIVSLRYMWTAMRSRPRTVDRRNRAARTDRRSEPGRSLI